jgi:hypothetical protein
VIKTEDNHSSTESGTANSIALLQLELSAPVSLSKITERDIIHFKAIVYFKDGTHRDVTTEASWRVLGPIGNISTTGVFSAMLEPDTAEFGIGSGAVVATWQDPISGAEILGKSVIFEVKAYVPATIERQG